MTPANVKRFNQSMRSLGLSNLKIKPTAELLQALDDDDQVSFINLASMQFKNLPTKQFDQTITLMRRAFGRSATLTSPSPTLNIETWPLVEEGGDFPMASYAKLQEAVTKLAGASRGVMGPIKPSMRWKPFAPGLPAAKSQWFSSSSWETPNLWTGEVDEQSAPPAKITDLNLRVSLLRGLGWEVVGDFTTLEGEAPSESWYLVNVCSGGSFGGIYSTFLQLMKECPWLEVRGEAQALMLNWLRQYGLRRCTILNRNNTQFEHFEKQTFATCEVDIAVTMEGLLNFRTTGISNRFLTDYTITPELPSVMHVGSGRTAGLKISYVQPLSADRQDLVAIVLAELLNTGVFAPFPFVVADTSVILTHAGP